MRLRLLRGRLVIWIALGATCLGGCVYDELLATHVEPGGKVKATLSGGAEMESTAIGHGTKEPLEIDGFSPNLTFGLTAGDDTAGSTAFVDLKKPNVAIALAITPTSRTRLEIHAGGAGCVAQTGTVNLHTDGNNNLGGDFQADGTLSDNTGPCQIAGTLDGVPVER